MPSVSGSKRLLGVKSPRQPGPPLTSEPGGKADIIGAIPDIGSAMSSFGGKPDVTEGEP